MNYKKRFEDGQKGVYKGLNNGLGGINRHIYNVQRKCYYLVGGLSNSGKTTLVDSILLNAIRDANSQGIPIDIFYYSYEIDEETKFAQWLSNHIFMKYGIMIPPECIAHLGDNTLEQHQKDLVEMEMGEVQRIFSQIKFRFDPTNPTGIYKELYDYYSSTGKWEVESYTGQREGRDGEMIEEQKERIVAYTHNNPERYVIVVMDHIALCKLERKYTLKENIDKMSQYAVWLRNMCSTTFIMLQQFNQGLHSIDRKKYNGEELVPQQNDFKDSGNPYQDCEVALGIMNPHAMNTDAKMIFGYSLVKIKRNFRVINIIKNRKGRAQVVFGYFFNPKTGFFRNLPLPTELLDVDYQKINDGTYN